MLMRDLSLRTGPQPDTTPSEFQIPS